ncbi:spore germination protein GerPB [Priestia megaterium]|uniref:spore germination protein GerPB n=1 Tax=Priestia megaterium TaxID=1404 RepID=UPI002ECAE03B|nr:spore germination protein GerPB [Priestia megaterium]
MKISAVSNSSVLQIGSVGVIKPNSNLFNTGGFTGAAPTETKKRHSWICFSFYLYSRNRCGHCPSSFLTVVNSPSSRQRLTCYNLHRHMYIYNYFLYQKIRDLR